LRISRYFNYDIHGIVKARSNIQLPDILPPFFEVKSTSRPDLTVNVGDFLPPERGVYRECGLFAFRLKLWVGDLLDSAKVFFNTPMGFSRPIVFDVIKGVLQFKLLRKGYSFIHGACLSKEGEGILLVAPPETGKTFTTLLLSKQGFEFLSDDMTIINGKRGRCYPIPLTLHSYHIRELGIEAKGVSKLKLLMSDLSIPPLSYGFKLQPEDLRLKVVKEAEIVRIYFLERGGEEVRKLKEDIALRRLLSAGRMHIKLFENEHILQYFYLEGVNIWELMKVQRAIIEELAEGCESYLVKGTPKTYGKQILSSLL